MWLVFTDAGDGDKIPPHKVAYKAEDINEVCEVAWGRKNNAKTGIGISNSYTSYAELLDDFDDVVERVQQAQAQAQMTFRRGRDVLL